MAFTMRFVTWFAGASIALYLATLVAMMVLDITPESAAASNLDLSESLTWFRVTGYIAVIAFWKQIGHFFIRPPQKLVMDSKATAELVKKRQFESARWKVALFFGVFEVLAIQQILGGFAS